MKTCIFCQIVAKELPSYTVWEDDVHLAFLSIFPNTEGVTVVIPKEHATSYAFDLSDEGLSALMIATKKVAKILDEKLEDVGRTGMVFEGFGVDHVHAKLFPLHGTANIDEWKPIESKKETYFTQYPGYISSHDANRASDDDLEALAKRLRT